MKAAISLEDKLMVQADAAARGLSRSGLVAEALRDYLRPTAGAGIGKAEPRLRG